MFLIVALSVIVQGLVEREEHSLEYWVGLAEIVQVDAEACLEEMRVARGPGAVCETWLEMRGDMLTHAAELEAADRPSRQERRFIDRANQVAEETSPVLVRWRYWLES